MARTASTQETLGPEARSIGRWPVVVGNTRDPRSKPHFLVLSSGFGVDSRGRRRRDPVVGDGPSWYVKKSLKKIEKRRRRTTHPVWGNLAASHFAANFRVALD